jgi:transcriptional regulator with XRE-family HTH domain
MSQEPTEDAAPELGKRITELRERRGWTQKQLAEKAGFSVAFLSEIENGKRNVSSAKLLRIADELGASLDYLMRGEQAEVRERRPVEVPPELDDAAREQGWSYEQTWAVLQARQLVRARRSPKGTEVPQQYSKEDWIDLYRRLFE